VAINGHVYYGNIVEPCYTNFNGGKTKLMSSSTSPIDFGYYEWLATHIVSGTYNNGYQIIVTSTPPPKVGSCYTMYDFLSESNAAQGSNNGKTLIVFTTSTAICITQTYDGRQFGPSILAPFSEVTLTNAGYIDGIIIAKRFTTVMGSNNIGSEQQLHGNVYCGPIVCTVDPPCSNNSSTTTLKPVTTTTTTTSPTTTKPTTSKPSMTVFSTTTAHPSTIKPTFTTTTTSVCVPSLTYTLPSNLTLDGVTSPKIDGYINRTGDGIGDDSGDDDDNDDALSNWNGTEYDGFLQLNMYIAGVSTKPIMGKAFIGYDCNSKMLCVAAHLLANDVCSVEVSDEESWVEFTDGSPTTKLHRMSSGANFQYVKYSGGTTGNPIGK
jgi:hypothetical protein